MSYSRQIYTASMTQDRFKNILRLIRFNDTCTRNERRANDKLAPLREVISIFATNCRNSYSASTNGRRGDGRKNSAGRMEGIL